MNAFLDDALVALVLATGFGYAVYSLGPRSLRKRMTLGAAALLQRLPRIVGLRGAARRPGRGLPPNRRAPAAAATVAGTEKSAAPAANGEVRIPLSKIGRRE